jgi:hypothetical protein
VERIVAGGGPPTIERWNFASLDAAVWLCSHDTYHLAQIRSMGIASLRGRKLS